LDVWEVFLQTIPATIHQASNHHNSAANGYVLKPMYVILVFRYVALVLMSINTMTFVALFLAWG
jgi:hypothetical protein